jgi:hypothetical protein
MLGEHVCAAGAVLCQQHVASHGSCGSMCCVYSAARSMHNSVDPAGNVACLSLGVCFQTPSMLCIQTPSSHSITHSLLYFPPFRYCCCLCCCCFLQGTILDIAALSAGLPVPASLVHEHFGQLHQPQAVQLLLTVDGQSAGVPL